MERARVFGKRILLVDDDPVARESMEVLLRIDRHTVVQAQTGAEAVHLFTGEPFDLVIIDYLMPGMKGSEVALTIKHMAPDQPIIMVTGYLEKLSESDKPVDAVLAKPFGVEVFRETIAKLLS